MRKRVLLLKKQRDKKKLQDQNDLKAIEDEATKLRQYHERRQRERLRVHDQVNRNISLMSVPSYPQGHTKQSWKKELEKKERHLMPFPIQQHVRGGQVNEFSYNKPVDATYEHFTSNQGIQLFKGGKSRHDRR